MEAIIKISGKEYNNVKAVKVSGDTECNIQIITSNGACHMHNEKNIKRPIRIEVKGNVNNLEVSNHAFIEGNCGIVEVGNCLHAEGYIKQCTAGNRVNKSEYTKVFSKKESEKINKQRVIQFQGGFDDIFKGLNISNDTIKPEPKPKDVVVHIDGDLEILSVNLMNREIYTEIKGNVRNVTSGNCLDIRGNCNSARAGNIIECKG